MIDPSATQALPLQQGRRARFAKLITAGAALALLAGCATLGGGTPEEVVEKRANARWAAWVKRDFTEAYKYNTPGYRGTVPYEKFVTLRGKDVRILKGEVNKVTCPTADKCDAQIKLTATAAIMMRQQFPKEIVTYVDETWVLEDGQWWLFEKI